MGGIVKHGKNYICERYYCGLGIQARRQDSIPRAQTTLRAIDRVVSLVEAKVNEKRMGGQEITLENFATYVRAAVAEVLKASPELGVENWRYYAKNRLDKPGFTKAVLRKLRKDAQISFGDTELRVLQDTLQNTLPGWLKLQKAAGLTNITDVTGMDGLHFGRRAADEFARVELARLKNGARPSDDLVLKALRLWSFAKSASRQNVMPDGVDWVHSDTLGVIESREDHSMILTTACAMYGNFVRLLCEWARKRSPDGELPFTTISLNKNYAGRLHRDAGNYGPSVGISTGPHTGGKLRYWYADSQKGQRSKYVEEVRHVPSVALKIKDGVVFDGNCAHEVEPFKGERYSLIFFTVKKYKLVSGDVKRRMISVGADWSTSASLKRLMTHVPGANEE